MHALYSIHDGVCILLDSAPSELGVCGMPGQKTQGLMKLVDIRLSEIPRRDLRHDTRPNQFEIVGEYAEAPLRVAMHQGYLSFESDLALVKISSSFDPQCKVARETLATANLVRLPDRA